MKGEDLTEAASAFLGGAMAGGRSTCRLVSHVVGGHALGAKSGESLSGVTILLVPSQDVEEDLFGPGELAESEMSHGDADVDVEAVPPIVNDCTPVPKRFFVVALLVEGKTQPIACRRVARVRLDPVAQGLEAFRRGGKGRGLQGRSEGGTCQGDQGQDEEPVDLVLHCFLYLRPLRRAKLLER